MPNQPADRSFAVTGVVSIETLQAAIESAAAVSADGKSRLGSDMRAHLNATRMASIRAVAYRLSRRLAPPCPACGAPGFDLADLARGLPCAWCSRPTDVVVAEILRCPKCGVESQRPIRDLPAAAEPGHCANCNP